VDLSKILLHLLGFGKNVAETCFYQDSLNHSLNHCWQKLANPVYCGQTAGWIKMPLGTEVGLGPGDIVLDGDPAPPQGGTTAPPLFGPSIAAKQLY